MMNYLWLNMTGWRKQLFIRSPFFSPLSCCSPPLYSAFTFSSPSSCLSCHNSVFFLCFSPAVRSRGAVRLIRARVQQAIRWAFVTSCVPHTNSGARGQGSTAHPHSGGMAAAERIKRERCWNQRNLIQDCSFVSADLLLCTRFMLYIRFSLVIFSDFIMIILYFSHACCVIFRGAPVVYSGLFASLVLWFYLSKRITLGSITLCHHHHWCCCWDISLCLNPSCVIKVPLCISSPSLSENLSCPLMGVCWWVSLIVGYGLQCHLCLQ